MLIFWTPTPWNLRKLKQGEKFYFLLKAPIRQIGGFAEYVEYKNLTADQAWNEYGIRNGRTTKELFLDSIKSYLDKNSKKFRGTNITPENHIIGCIILKNCIFFDDEGFLNTEDYGLKFPTQIVKIKYINSVDPFFSNNNDKKIFTPINDKKIKNYVLTDTRIGQGLFSGMIKKAYNNQCCVSGEKIPELLNAAHIQSYINADSHHVQNGLLMRVDIHALYDAGLISIDENYDILVSEQLNLTDYYKYKSKKITLPVNRSDFPSKDALKLKLKGFRL